MTFMTPRQLMSFTLYVSLELLGLSTLLSYRLVYKHVYLYYSTSNMLFDDSLPVLPCMESRATR